MKYPHCDRAQKHHPKYSTISRCVAYYFCLVHIQPYSLFCFHFFKKTLLLPPPSFNSNFFSFLEGSVSILSYKIPFYYKQATEEKKHKLFLMPPLSSSSLLSFCMILFCCLLSLFIITKVPNEQLETLCYLTYAKKIFLKKFKNYNVSMEENTHSRY